MSRVLSKQCDTKYKCIIAHERSWAGALATSLRQARPVSVWEVLMPFLLIFNYARRKTDREIFIQNVLYTKELALKAALGLAKSGRGRSEAITLVEEKTRKLLSTVDEAIYSEEIRQKQLVEMDLLIDHYARLLAADGRDYRTLVINSYRTQDLYVSFLEQLKHAEREVNISALKTVGSRGDPQFVQRIEEKIDSLRMASVERIFGESG